jgi:hypothetical protein
LAGVRGQALALPPPRAWTVRKQSEQYTGLSMRGLKGTCAALPHCEQMTAKYSRVER